MTDLTAPPLPVPFKKHPLVAPIDVSRVKKEAGVKDLIKRLLEFHGWFTWMPAANGFGMQGVSDHLALKDGVFLAIEAKFGNNKPSPMQKSFAAHVLSNSAYAFCVTEKNIDHFAMWLESFQFSIEWQLKGHAAEALPQEHGSRLLNAISALTAPFTETVAAQAQ